MRFLHSSVNSPFDAYLIPPNLSRCPRIPNEPQKQTPPQIMSQFILPFNSLGLVPLARHTSRTTARIGIHCSVRRFPRALIPQHCLLSLAQRRHPPPAECHLWPPPPFQSCDSPISSRRVGRQQKQLNQTRTRCWRSWQSDTAAQRPCRTDRASRFGQCCLPCW